MFTNNNTKHWCKCLDTLSKQIKQYSIHQKVKPSVNHQHLHSLPHNRIPCFMRFPPQYPPPRPQLLLFFASTAAFASRSRWTTESWPLLAAKCSGVAPWEPRPEAKPRAAPNGTKGRKFGEKFGRLKSRSFGNFGHSKIIPGLKERCAFEEVLMTSSWLKKLLPLAFWQSRCHG